MADHPLYTELLKTGRRALLSLGDLAAKLLGRRRPSSVVILQDGAPTVEVFPDGRIELLLYSSNLAVAWSDIKLSLPNDWMRPYTIH